MRRVVSALSVFFFVLFVAMCGGGGADSPPVASEGDTDGANGNQAGGVTEGQWSGLFFRGGTECPSVEANPIAGAAIYVSPDGSDDNAGTEATAALKTVTKALCNARPGQTINVMPGTYRESVILYGFGDDSAPLIIHGVESGGAKPVFDGDTTLTMGIAIVSGRNIVVENLRFTNFTDEGFLAVTGANITVRNCEFIGNGVASIEPDYDGEGFGLQMTDVSDALIENNRATENGPGPERTAQFIVGTGIDTFGLVNGVIRGNTSSRNVGGGMLIENGVNVLVENNIIEENDLDVSADGWWDGGVWVDGGQNVVIRNNTIRNNLGPAIEVSDEDLQYPAASKGHLVEQNTITGNYWALYTFNFGVCQLPAEDILIWRDNIVENNVYTGPLREEWQYDRGQQTMCTEWPCGENTAC